MKVGLQIPSFTWPGGPEAIGPTLARVVRDADEVGFDSIWVMDHFFQIRGVGPPEEPMLEELDRARVHGRALDPRAAGPDGRRRPLPAAGPLDQGRDDARRAVRADGPGSGSGPPGTRRSRGRWASRSRRSASASRCSRTRSGSPTGCGPASAARRRRSRAATFRATRLLNSPQSISRPRVPIMIGGGGEQKTLRLVAQYADACNVFGSPEMIAHKYAVLDEHCAAVGRDHEEIERSTLQGVNLADGSAPRRDAAQVVDRFGDLADAGAEHVIFSVQGVHDRRGSSSDSAEVIPRCRRYRTWRRMPAAYSRGVWQRCYDIGHEGQRTVRWPGHRFRR